MFIIIRDLRFPRKTVEKGFVAENRGKGICCGKSQKKEFVTENHGISQKKDSVTQNCRGKIDCALVEIIFQLHIVLNNAI